MFDSCLLDQTNVVYCLRHRVSGKVYIGKTVKALRERWGCHKWYAFKGGSTTYFHRSLRKYGEDSFELSILATAKNNTELCELEKGFISQMGANNAATGYNLTAGGEGSLGYVPTKETLDKLRQRIHHGHPPSIETRIRLSIANASSRHPLHGVLFSDDKVNQYKHLLGEAPYRSRATGLPRKKPSYSDESRARMGNRNSPTREVREKISTANRGKERSEESRARYRASKLGENNPQFGKIGTKQGTRWIHLKSGERKMVPVDEVMSYTKLGWLLGMPPRRGK